MRGGSRKLTAFFLSYALAFSPLAPVNYAIAEEQGEQGAIELSGNAEGDGSVVQDGDTVVNPDDQVVVLGEGTTPAPEGQKEEGQKEEEQAIELGNEGEQAEKAKEESARKTRSLLTAQGEGETIGFVDENGNDMSGTVAAWITADSEDTLQATPGNNVFAVAGAAQVERSKRMRVEGDVILVLSNDATLTCKKGIEIADGGSLKIYTQSYGGKLVAETNGDKLAAISVNEGSTLEINGGEIEATCKTYDGAGIGSDPNKNAGTITINNGTVTATSKKNGAGIGGGLNGNGGTITINGGKVTATAGDEDGAGIGGGDCGSSGKITITGDDTEVEATGASRGAGIGGGDSSSYGEVDSITITGGTVDAKGGAYAAGIGAGGDSGYGTIKISGGTITAKGGNESAGIGSANKGNVESIKITSGDIVAVGGVRGAGIGGGDGNDSNGGQYGTISISGEGTRVRAYGGKDAAGIGTGNEPKKNEGTISISDSALVKAVGGCKSVKVNDDRTVTYDGHDDFEPDLLGLEGAELEAAWRDLDLSEAPLPEGECAAGIGGGDLAPGGTIYITGEDTVVYAYGSNLGAGIGGGDDSGGKSSGKITIDCARVAACGGKHAAAIGGGDEGGIDTITISGGQDNNGGARVKACAGGDYGAGIGSGDCSNNGNKANWQRVNDEQGPTITIAGRNTEVLAVGGTSGAGIGNGDDGPGSNLTINIRRVGKFAGGIGKVVAVGKGSGAGIGGGNCPRQMTWQDAWKHAHSFKEINIEFADITALGSLGAGIGCGGRDASCWPNKSYNIGGTINIKDSFVSAISGAGGAGIGGGIFGYAEHINIEGGVTCANGGALETGENIYPGCNFLQEMGGSSNNNNLIPDWVIASMQTEAPDIDWLEGWWKKWTDGAHCRTFHFCGAGIGGGFRAPGGDIQIKKGTTIDLNKDGVKEDTQVIAASGRLPKGHDCTTKHPSHAIGSGGNYEARNKSNLSKEQLAWVCCNEHENYTFEGGCGDDYTTDSTDFAHDVQTPVTFVGLDKASVTTANLGVKNYDASDGSCDFELLDTDMKSSADPSAVDLVRTRHLAIIEPIYKGNVTATFDNNNAYYNYHHPGVPDATGATNYPDNKLTMNNDAQNLMLPVAMAYSMFERPGYVFDGWNEEPDGSGKAYAPADEEVGAALQTIADTSKYGTGEWNAAMALVQARCPFINKDTTYYAQWKAKPVTVHYYFVYSLEGGPDSVGAQTYMLWDTIECERGSELTLLTDSYRGSYAFDFWVEGDETGPTTDPLVTHAGGATITVPYDKDDLYLYERSHLRGDDAQYVNILIRDFVLGASDSITYSVKKGEKFILPDNIQKWDKTARGYIINDYVKLKEAEPPAYFGTTKETYALGQEIQCDSDLVICPRYRRVEYDVHFELNGASSQGVNDVGLSYYDPKTIGAFPQMWYANVSKPYETVLPSGLERENYDFAGWNTEPDGSGTAYMPGQRVSNLTGGVPQDHDTVTLYAQWTPSNVDRGASVITFHKNAPGESEDESYEQAVEAGATTAKLDKCKFERQNCKFLGWSTEPDGEVVYADEAEINIDGDLTLYAKWEEGKWATCTYSIKLEDSIDIIYHVKNLAEGTNPEDYSIEWSFGGGEPTAKTLTDMKDNEFTLASCNATQMTDDVDIVIKHKNEDGSETVIKESSVSIKRYCDSIISKPEQVEEQVRQQSVDFCKATLNYGRYAQEEFGYRMGDLANGGVDYADFATFTDTIPASGSTRAGSCEGINSEEKDGIRFSLAATSKTQFVVKFKHAEGANLNDYTFTVTDNGSNKVLPAERYDLLDRDGRFEVWIKGIKSCELGNNYTVNVKTDGETDGLTYTASPVNYMYLASSTGTAVNINKAFYNYYLAARDYADKAAAPSA